jgi:hypothetical protein
MPGALGGDTVKAFYIARVSINKRTKAITTIIIDRIMGFETIMVIAFIALMFNYNMIRLNLALKTLAIFLGVYIVCSILLATIVFSIRIKRFFVTIGTKRFVDKLPKKEILYEIYNAFHIYVEGHHIPQARVSYIPHPRSMAYRTLFTIPCR